MKLYFFLAMLTLIRFTGFAQSSTRQSIEESQPGWYKVYLFKGVKESKQMDNRVFSPAQLSVCDSFANWIQANYLPKGESVI